MGAIVDFIRINDSQKCLDYLTGAGSGAYSGLVEPLGFIMKLKRITLRELNKI